MQYPITAILGDRGAGKTCLMTFLAYAYYKEGKTIFTNYELYEIPHKRITLVEMKQLPDYLRNSVVLIDELHIWADAYEFMGKSAKALAKFGTQLRKRKVDFFYTTQIFTQVPKRLRDQTNYHIIMRNTKTIGVFKAIVIDRFNASQKVVNSFEFDGKPFFNKYDTDEVIDVEDEEEA